MTRGRASAYLSTAFTSLALLALPVDQAFSQAATAAQGTATGVTAANAVADTAAGGQLPTVEVVATTPLGAGTSDLNVPSETQTLTSQDIDQLSQPTLQDALARRTPGVSVTDVIGSPLSQSVDFRGETATPVPGTPEAWPFI